ncbi:HAD-like domain-containing protein [Coniochaeta sp. 2T2.1]|nr:HAD-like domain-containing protein [Coniochaeta sp. 2T2.1]
MSATAAPVNSSSSIQLVLLDLDSTLFDHHHSLQSAISACQQHFPVLAVHSLPTLTTAYNAALQHAYDRYLAKEITYDETEPLKVGLFFTSLGISTPPTVQEFRSIYKPVYRASSRATPGAIETLIRLRERGYRLAIVTNGQTEEQQAKAEAIGVLGLVERVFTSQGLGMCKPEGAIFRFAVRQMGVEAERTVMVGDSVEADVKGAVDAGLGAILYAPEKGEALITVCGEEVPVVHSMEGLIGYLDTARGGWE